MLNLNCQLRCNFKYLITFAIIFKTTAAFTVATFVVSSCIVTGFTAFPDFRSKGVRVTFQAGFNRALSLLFIPKIIRAIVAIAHVTKFAVRKTIAITERKILYKFIFKSKHKKIVINFASINYF